MHGDDDYSDDDHSDDYQLFMVMMIMDTDDANCEWNGDCIDFLDPARTVTHDSGILNQLQNHRLPQNSSYFEFLEIQI